MYINYMFKYYPTLSQLQFCDTWNAKMASVISVFNLTLNHVPLLLVNLPFHWFFLIYCSTQFWSTSQVSNIMFQPTRNQK